MGWSFRRSKSFGPFRLNFSKSGMGFSFGAPGARIGVNAKGKKYVRGGIPGTGLYYQSTLPDAPRTQEGRAASNVSPLGVLVALVLGGLIIFAMFSYSPQTRPAPVTPTPQIAVPVTAPITPKPVVRKHKRKPAVHHTAAVATKPDAPAAEQAMPDIKPLADTESK
jgi:hypothetical protein